MKKFTVNTRRVQISFISLITITLLLFIGCSNPDLLDSTPPNDIQAETENEQNMDELFLQELQKLESRGNFGNPDFDSEGQMFYIYIDSFSKS